MTERNRVVEVIRFRVDGFGTEYTNRQEAERAAAVQDLYDHVRDCVGSERWTMEDIVAYIRENRDELVAILTEMGDQR